jgi:hypothetical protein
MSEDGGDERPTLDEVRGHLSVLRAAMDNAVPGAEYRRAREEADRLQVVLDALDERTRKLTLESCKRLVADNEIARLRAMSDDSCGTSSGTSPCGPCGVCRECLRDSARSAQARADSVQQRAEKAERDFVEVHSQLAALHAAASAYRNCDAGHDAVRSLRYEPFTHPETGETLYRAGVERPTFEVLDRALADAATAANPGDH